MASKRAIRRKKKRKGCDNKARHRTEADAMIAIMRMRKHGLHAYKCEFCGGWHVGHKEAQYNGNCFNRADYARTLSLP